jgi:hypothetical protein
MPSQKAFQLQLAFRDLWMGHLFWVRSAVQDARHADGDAGRVSQARVIQNARDIADSFRPYYGADLSDRLFGLLVRHDTALREYGEAAFKKDAEGQRTAAGALSANAGDVATLIASSNTGWKREALEKLFQAQSEQQEKQITCFVSADFSSEAELWTNMVPDAYFLADTLALGIVGQFPTRF